MVHIKPTDAISGIEMSDTKDGQIVDRRVESNGAVWVQVWERYNAGLLQLVWREERSLALPLKETQK